MTILLYEFDEVVEATGEPLEPPSRRRAGLALDTVVGLAQSTRAVRITTTADCYIRFSADGSAATSADTPLAAGDVLQAPVSPTRPVYVCATA